MQMQPHVLDDQAKELPALLCSVVQRCSWLGVRTAHEFWRLLASANPGRRDQHPGAVLGWSAGKQQFATARHCMLVQSPSPSFKSRRPTCGGVGARGAPVNLQTGGSSRRVSQLIGG